ncbi:MAG: substrate-binding domain-containing protein, partial [Myxococcales bacterium]|nr:substrate-binding domain-containing protein [Myxococcales bacterium]
MSTDMDADEDPLRRVLSRGLSQLFATLLFIGLLVYWGVTGSLPGRGVHESSPLVDVRLIGADFAETCGAFGADRRPVKLSMFSAPAKREWIDRAAADFSRKCPNIQLHIEHIDDLDAAQSILESGVAPSLWAPTSATVVEVLAWAWESSPYEPDSGRPLVRAPVVWMGSSEAIRVARALVEHNPGEGPWLQAACAGLGREVDPAGLARADMLPGSWSDWYEAALADPSVERISDEVGPVSPAMLAGWGRVRFRHPHPLDSDIGFAALYMIALDYLSAPNRGGSPEFRREDFAAG